MHPTVTVDVEEHVAYLRFNRPEVLNALNLDMAKALADACHAVATDENVRVVVLDGNGKAFMAGGDLQALRAAPIATVNALIPVVHEAVRTLTAMPKPVLASVHGAAAGAGMSLALAADLIVASGGARFTFAYNEIGTSCDGGMSWTLPRLVGLRKALEIAMLGETLSSEEALHLGLINQVIPTEHLDTTVRSLAQRLARSSTHALGHIKRLMRMSHERSLSTQLDAEHAAFLDCAGRAEFTNGIDAFFASRARTK